MKYNNLGIFLRRTDLIDNLVQTQKLREQQQKPNRSIQEANQRRWQQYQEIQRNEITAKIIAANGSGGIVNNFDPDAQAFITAAGITNPTQQNAVNQLTLDLKSYNIWSSMNAIYPFVGGTATTHKYNLKDPRDLNVAYRITFGGGWTHNSNGATGNGVNTYADTNYNGFQSGELGIYNRGGGAQFGGVYDEWEGGDYPVYGVPWIYSNTSTNSGTSWFSDNVDQSNNLNSSGTNLNLGLIGLFGGTGTAKYYKNGILNSSLSSLPNASSLSVSLWLGGINNNGIYSNPTYGNSQLAFGFITTVQLNDTQNANLYTAVQAFQTTLGRQV